MVLGLGAVCGMAVAAANSVLGFQANLTIMNSNATGALNGFSMSSSRLTAVDAGFGMAPVQQQDGTWKNVLRAGFSSATISGLCLSKTEKLPIIGTDYTLRLTSPSSAGSISASNGVFDITDIAADTSGAAPNNGINLKGNTQVGLTTTDITTVFANGTSLPYKAEPFASNDDAAGDSPLDIWNSSVYSGAAPPNWVVDGKPHTFGGGWTGIDAGGADLYKIAGRLWQVQLTGNITLPKLSIGVSSGDAQCADWPSGPPYTNTTKYDGTNLFP